MDIVIKLEPDDSEVSFDTEPGHLVDGVNKEESVKCEIAGALCDLTEEKAFQITDKCLIMEGDEGVIPKGAKLEIAEGEKCNIKEEDDEDSNFPSPGAPEDVKVLTIDVSIRNSGRGRKPITDSQQHQCKVCQKYFASGHKLKLHVRFHTGEKPYECIICAKRFALSGTLQAHTRTHTGEKRHQCSVCMKSFTQSTNLRRHSQIHIGEKPLQCTVCSKYFRQSDDLRKHARIHTGEKAYKCMVCSKGFTSSSEVRRHERTHTREKPHQCQVCLKSFTQAITLQKHGRIHTGEKRYECTVCSKKFTDSGDLRKHARTHTGEKPFQCKICGQWFGDRSNLGRHVRRHNMGVEGENIVDCDMSGDVPAFVEGDVPEANLEAIEGTGAAIKSEPGKRFITYTSPREHEIGNHGGVEVKKENIVDCDMSGDVPAFVEGDVPEANLEAIEGTGAAIKSAPGKRFIAYASPREHEIGNHGGVEVKKENIVDCDMSGDVPAFVEGDVPEANLEAIEGTGAAIKSEPGKRFITYASPREHEIGNHGGVEVKKENIVDCDMSGDVPAFVEGDVPEANLEAIEGTGAAIKSAPGKRFITYASPREHEIGNHGGVEVKKENIVDCDMSGDVPAFVEGDVPEANLEAIEGTGAAIKSEPGKRFITYASPREHEIGNHGGVEVKKENIVDCDMSGDVPAFVEGDVPEANLEAIEGTGAAIKSAPGKRFIAYASPREHEIGNHGGVEVKKENIVDCDMSGDVPAFVEGDVPEANLEAIEGTGAAIKSEPGKRFITYASPREHEIGNHGGVEVKKENIVDCDMSGDVPAFVEGDVPEANLEAIEGTGAAIKSAPGKRFITYASPREHEIGNHGGVEVKKENIVDCDMSGDVPAFVEGDVPEANLEAIEGTGAAIKSEPGKRFITYASPREHEIGNHGGVEVKKENIVDCDMSGDVPAFVEGDVPEANLEAIEGTGAAIKSEPGKRFITYASPREHEIGNHGGVEVKKENIVDCDMSGDVPAFVEGDVPEANLEAIEGTGAAITSEPGKRFITYASPREHEIGNHGGVEVKKENIVDCDMSGDVPAFDEGDTNQEAVDVIGVSIKSELGPTTDAARALHDPENTDEKLFQCFVCRVRFPCEGDLLEHKVREKHGRNIGEKPHGCSQCRARFFTYASLQEHEKSTHNDVRKQSTQTHQCPVCSKCLPSKYSLEKHTITHKGKKLEECLSSSGSLENHRITNTEENPYQCPICSKCLSSKRSLEEHTRTHTGEKTYQCTVCSKTFSAKRSLKKHAETHTGKKPYQCVICSKCYKSSDGLWLHKRSHTTERYTCETCSKQFTTEKSLLRHMQIHSGEAPYQCPVCSKCFLQKCTLQLHARIHSGEKPYKCDVCSRGFGYKNNLLTHKRVHTGEKPYKCEVCLKSFTQVNTLLNHSRRHSGERRYECKVCLKKFLVSGDMRKHERTHTGERPFQCNICGQWFRDRSNLRKHMKRKHNKEVFAGENEAVTA